LNFLSIQTRLNSKIEGPKALGAATSGFIEAEFFGTSEGDMNGLRLRHAYLSLKWTNASLLIGQTWHPMFISEAYPMVVSFNTGAPFIAFSRNPQIRFNYSFDNFTLISALISQRDFTSNGPNGFSSVYMRNAGIPALHLQLKYNSNNILAGIGGGVKKIVPQIETSKKISTDESLTSFDGISYVKYSSTNFAVALQGIYGQNLADFLMLGGYGVCESDTATGNQCYTNQKAYSLWSDIYYGTDIQAGLFFGYSKNLGSDKKIIGASYSRVNNIDDIFRVSPRIVYRTGKIVLAAEFEYTKAGYGLQDSYGKVPSPYKVKNSRVLLGVFYNF
jgi:hypothetical protein